MLPSIFINLLLFLHPFYVSVTEINHNAKTKAVEVSCRMFYDDLEKTINRHYHVKIDIVKPTDRLKVNQLLNDYIKKHLTIAADGKQLNLSFLGYEIQEDGAWAYFEAKDINRVKQISVHDNLLYDEHPEQINMLHITVDGNRKSTKLDNPNADANMVF